MSFQILAVWLCVHVVAYVKYRQTRAKSRPRGAYIPLPVIDLHKATPAFTSPPSESLRSISPSASDSEDAQNSLHKSPNVYINGLPPNFPEEQLVELAVPFGDVTSVRCFTRYIGEKESGYGFVLFETVESAERFIESLRGFRDLHPSFSKQVHKIPGTPFAQSPSFSSTSSSLSEQGTDQDEDASFKAEMDRLHDPKSTNLYIEGLPLSIDEPALSSLVAPHMIKSHRFFQTRLSNPPRVIAFVRLDTRAGAEDIIDRLHGRVVRGWKDTGCRIAVRFADTAEQKELRAQHAILKQGCASPAPLATLTPTLM